jgi:uncharacterized phage-associated protein
MSKNRIRKLAPKKAVHIAKSDNRLEELVVLLASRSKDDPKFGAIKLNKLLFYSDFIAYRLLGQPITGQEYFALENGPALRHKARFWNRMEKSKSIAVRREPTFFDTPREVTLALREPNVSIFTPQQLDVVYRVLTLCRDMDGSDLSQLTHQFPGWKLAREKETIPYSIALVGSRKPSPKEVAYGMKLEEALAQAA